MRRPFVYLILVMIWLVVACNDQPEQNKLVNHPETAPQPVVERAKSHQTPLKGFQTDSITVHSEKSHLYSAHILQHVAKEAPLTMLGMNSKQGNINRNFSAQITENHIELPPQRPMSWQLRIQFQNDIFTNTDYYFTNGAQISFTSSMARKGFFDLLVGAGKGAQVEFTGFSIRQNIYTPTNPDVTEVLVGDRPFSGYLAFGQFRETYNTKKAFIVKSVMEFGVLGPASFGDRVQSSIHRIEPVGWDNQIRNTPAVNYFLTLEKGLLNGPHVELNVLGSVAAGTVFNSISPGFYFRTGSFVPVLKDEAASGDGSYGNRQIQYWFFVEAKTGFVVYDATLQGNMFNNNDPYVIASSDISRFVPQLQAGLAMYYQRVGLECSAFYLAPEFKQARDFRWGSIRIIYNF